MPQTRRPHKCARVSFGDVYHSLYRVDVEERDAWVRRRLARPPRCTRCERLFSKHVLTMQRTHSLVLERVSAPVLAAVAEAHARSDCKVRCLLSKAQAQLVRFLYRPGGRIVARLALHWDRRWDEVLGAADVQAVQLEKGGHVQAHDGP